jgi:TPP-dependent pyruvate/acetoin dehydrogenase alpha subunit
MVERAKIKSGMLTRIDEVAGRQVEEAVQYAESVPFPQPGSVTDRLFAPSPHDPTPEDRKNNFEPIEDPAIPALTASSERKTGEHF